MNKLSDDLCISLALELIATLFQERFNVSIVCDNSIVNNDESVFDVRTLWMGIQFAGRTVSSPTRVRNSAMCVDRNVKILADHLLGDRIFKNLNLSGLLDQNDSFRVVTVNGNASRVIATILQALEASDKIFENFATSFRRQIV